jgi:putative peptidoglycan lipid II flippase
LELDDIAWRALQPDEELPLNTPKKVADALDSADKPHPRSPDEPTPSMPWPVLGMGLVALLMLAGVLLLAWQIWQDQSRPDATAAPPTSTPSPSATASPSAPVETVIPIASVVAFDPAGDNEENDEQAAAAIDGDATTAWRTLTYASRDLGQLKPGVGLRLNLGGQQAVSGVELQLVGRGTDLQIWAERGDVRPPSENPLAGYRTLASVRGAGDELTLRFAPAVRTRAIVVWLTALPADGTGYRGVIAEVTLLS